MSLQSPIRLDESEVKGCSLLEGYGDFGELLVSQCDEDTVSSLSLADPLTSLTLARTLTPQEFTVANIIESFLPDPRIPLTNLLGDINIVNPVVFRIPIKEEFNIGGFTVPVDATIEYDATDALERAGRALIVALLDEILGSLWPTDFDDRHPGSEAGQDEVMRILFRFAFYRYFQSQHTLFEKQESRQLESTGQYLSIKDGRPKEVSLTEVVTNTLILIASAAGWGWSIGHATKSYRAGNGLDLSTVASVAGSTVMLLGALVVFAFQWGAMKTRLNYSQSILILETMIFSRTGTAFFGRVFRDFDIVSVAASFVNVQDVSADYTWLFVLGTLLTITAIGVAGVLGWRSVGQANDIPYRWAVAFAICWCIVLFAIPLAIGLSSNDSTELSAVSSTTSILDVGSPTGFPTQSMTPTSTPYTTEILNPIESPEQLPTPAPKPPTQTPKPTGAPVQSPMPTSKPSIQTLELSVLPPGVAGGITCKNCCQGTQACTENNGTIADNSCNGNYACQNNDGMIESNTCNGDSACDNNKGTVRHSSCSKNYACQMNTGVIGIGSCLGKSACKFNKSFIGDGSCMASYACQNNNIMIGSSSCSGTSACKTNDGEIGDRSCLANFACQGNNKTIGSGSCSGRSACKSNSAVIGDDVCNTNYACQG
jgi:hypothetical protein